MKRKHFFQVYFPSVLAFTLLTDKVSFTSFSDQSVYYKIFILLMRSTFVPLSLSLSLSLSYFYFKISRSSNRIRDPIPHFSIRQQSTETLTLLDLMNLVTEKGRKTPSQRCAIFSAREWFCSACEYGKFECAGATYRQREPLNSIVFVPTIVAIFPRFSTTRGFRARASSASFSRKSLINR